jgi:hypothetical protein
MKALRSPIWSEKWSVPARNKISLHDEKNIIEEKSVKRHSKLYSWMRINFSCTTMLIRIFHFNLSLIWPLWVDMSSDRTPTCTKNYSLLWPWWLGSHFFQIRSLQKIHFHISSNLTIVGQPVIGSNSNLHQKLSFAMALKAGQSLFSNSTMAKISLSHFQQSDHCGSTSDRIELQPAPKTIACYCLEGWAVTFSNSHVSIFVASISHSSK